MTDIYFAKTTGSTNAVLKLILAIIVCLPVRLFAQEQLYQQAQKKTDTLLKAKPAEAPVDTKHFGRAAIELGLAEVLPWTWDKFLKKAPYANISFKTVAHNLNPGSWAFDNDNFQTNQFGHPYQGSLFFSSFRANGYSFWQSVPAAFVGSYIWESTAENQAPAPNDFINTGFGGTILGEMTFRISNKIINEHHRGFKRTKEEVAAFILNPMNGLTRLLNGKWGKVKFDDDMSPGAIADSSKISAEFDLGGRRFSVNGGGPFNSGGRFGWYGRASLLYGSRYDDIKTPFRNIIITAEFGQDDSTKVNVVSVYGSLTGWLLESNSEVRHIAIISANYDYIHNVAFFYGGQSVKMNLYSNFKLNDDVKLNTAIGAGPVVLAAIPDPYTNANGRNYDYGPGFAINGMAGIDVYDHLYFSVNYRGGWMETVNGNSSHYFLHAVTGEFSYRIVDGLSLAAEAGYFRLNGSFKNYADIDKTYPYVRTSVRYAVDF